MPRKPLKPAERAARKITRGTAHPTAAHVLATARREDFWHALLDGQRGIFWSRNGKKARRNVVKRHPVKR